MIDTVTVNGAPIDPMIVLAEVIVTHGRQTFADGPTASTTSVQLSLPSGPMPPYHGGDRLQLSGPDGYLFTGRIIDRALTHPWEESRQEAILTMTGMGTVATLGVRVVGDEPWPQETGAARADRILTLSNLVPPHQIDGVVDLQVLARDVDAQPALTLLDELASSTGAAVFDKPDGTVVYQALSGRDQPVIPFMWSDFPPGDMWSGFDPALTWNGDPPSIGQWPSPTSDFPVPLPAAQLEWAPEWSASETSIVNHIRVGWGPDTGSGQAVVENTDQASITAHSRRYTYLGTILAGSADAATRAAHIISTQAQEHWAIGDLTVAVDELAADQRTQVLHLVCGDHIALSGLPQPGPAEAANLIVEGWTYRQWTDPVGVHSTLTLDVSSPLHSLAVMRWDDYPGTYQWADHPGYLTWADLYTTDDLGAAA